MSLKFSKQNSLEKSNENDEDVEEEDENKKLLSYTAGQYAYFDIGGVTNDPKGPIRHFTIASSPTENFILISTRIRDSPYKKDLHY
jgi:ferredoxin-NADP reductase